MWARHILALVQTSRLKPQAGACTDSVDGFTRTISYTFLPTIADWLGLLNQFRRVHHSRLHVRLKSAGALRAKRTKQRVVPFGSGLSSARCTSRANERQAGQHAAGR
eukprot:s6932_g4.t1